MTKEIPGTVCFKEWFGSEASAQKAAQRLHRMGYSTNVRYARAADGRSDWMLEVYY